MPKLNFAIFKPNSRYLDTLNANDFISNTTVTLPRIESTSQFGAMSPHIENEIQTARKPSLKLIQPPTQRNKKGKPTSERVEKT